jgi:hypothetical protein
VWLRQRLPIAAPCPCPAPKRCPPPGIKVSYSYPDQYKRAHERQILASFSDEVLAGFKEQQPTAPAPSPLEPFQPVSCRAAGLADVEAGADEAGGGPDGCQDTGVQTR